MTQRTRVLRMLEEGPVTTAGFLRAHIPRFSARIRELKQSGYTIETKRLRDGSWRYTLVRDVEDVGGAGALESTDSFYSDPGPSGGLFDAEEYRQRRRYGFEEAA